jgi:6-phospho-3-hexuloisomerase
MNTEQHINAMLESLADTLHRIDADQVEALKSHILSADRIFVAGKGRSGLQMRAFAMRLMHLGLKAHVVDEATTPGIETKDLLILGSGSGRTASLLRYAERVQSVGATLGAVVGDPASPLAEMADTIVVVPASNYKAGQSPSAMRGADSVLVMGSLFEHSLGLLCDLLVRELMDALDVLESEMNARHANLE